MLDAYRSHRTDPAELAELLSAARRQGAVAEHQRMLSHLRQWREEFRSGLANEHLEKFQIAEVVAAASRLVIDRIVQSAERLGPGRG